MYCPNCGKTNSTEHKFCRSCGFNLEKTAQSLVEQIPADEIEKSLQDKQRLVGRLLTILVGGGISIFVIILVWTIISKIIIGKGELFGGLIFIAFIVGLILFALLMLYSESLSEKAGKKQLLQKQTQQVTDSTQKLLYESHFEPITSVTERTTELLTIEKKHSTKEM